MVAKGVLRLHIARNKRFELAENPLYSPDFTHFDYHLFPKLKWIAGQGDFL